MAIILSQTNSLVIMKMVSSLKTGLRDPVYNLLLEIQRETPFNKNDVVNAVIYYTPLNEIMKKLNEYEKTCLIHKPQKMCGDTIHIRSIMYTRKVLDKLRTNNLDRHNVVNALLLYNDRVSIMRYANCFFQSILKTHPNLLELLDECELSFDLRVRYNIFDLGLDYLGMVGCLK